MARRLRIQKTAIAKAETLTALDDIHPPYRPKRRSRATIASENGLEPLARERMRELYRNRTVVRLKVFSEKQETGLEFKVYSD